MGSRHSRPGRVLRALAVASFLAAPSFAMADEIDLQFPLEVTGDRGSEKVVPLGVMRAHGLNSLSFVVDYDPAVVVATRVDDTSMSRSFDLTFDASTAGHLVVTLDNGNVGPDEGTLVEITFDVVGAAGRTTALDLVSAEVNGGADTATLRDGVLRVIGPSSSVIRFTNEAGADTDTFTVGQPVFVELADADRDRDSGRAETLVAVVTTGVTRDDEEVDLTETGPSTGVFRGSIATVPHSVARNNGELDVRGEDTVTAAYEDPSDPSDTSTDQAAVRNAPTSAVLTFVDLYGQPAESSTVGEPVFVKLVDADRNLNPGARDTVRVSFTVDATRDAESIELIETGFASGEFVVSTGVATEFWAEATADGRFQVLATDRVRASYVDPAHPGETAGSQIDVAATPTGSLTRLVSVAGEDRTQFSIGAESVAVLVSDGDENRNPEVVDSVSVQVTGRVSNDVETLTLTETGTGTGVFRGVLATARAGAATPNDGVLQGLGGEPVSATYADASDAADRSTDAAVFVAEATFSTLRFTDSNGGALTEATIGDGVFVEVTDLDRDADPTSPDRVSARVDVGETSDYEPLSLVETGPSTGVFRSARLASALASPSVPGNTTLELNGASTAEAAYADENTSDDVATASIAFAVRRSDSTLKFIDPATGATRPVVFVGTEPAVIELVDSDRNGDAAAADTVAAVVTAPDSGDEETVMLVETGASTGRFRFALATLREANGTPGDGVLAGLAGASVFAGYADPADASDVSTASAVLGIESTPSSIDATDAAFFGVTSIVAGQKLHLVVRDADRDLDPAARDALSATITAPSGDVETLSLIETEPRSGLFRTQAGVVAAIGAPAPEDGLLQVVAGESVTARYADVAHPADVSTVAVRVDGPGRKSILRITDAFGRDVTTLLVGRDAIFATLSDPSADADSAAADSVVMQFLNPRTSDFENVTLVETGPVTGNFINPVGVGLAFGSVVSPDGTIGAIAGDTLAAGYSDAADPTDVATDSAAITVAAGTAVARFTDQAGTPRDRFEVGAERVFVTIQDGDQNANPDLAETIRAIITVSGTNDLENVDLVETGRSTGVFRNATGLTSATSSTGTRGNGVLEGRRGYFLEVAYTDPDDASDVAHGEAVFIVGHAPSATRIIDDAGRDVTVRTLVSDRIVVEVAESDKNGDRTIVEDLTAELTVPARGDREVVRLRETGPDTGVFRSSGVQTDFRVPGLPGNAVVEAADGDQVVVRYADVDDPADVTTDSITMRVRATASLVKATNASGTDVDRFRIGRDKLYVTVVDPDENRNPSSVQIIRARVVNPLTGDRETVTLVETGPNSGAFRNSGGLPLGSSTTPSVDDGRLDGSHLNEVDLQYEDPDAETNDDSSGCAELVMPTDCDIQFVTGGNFPTSRYQIGIDRVFVRVEDGNRNLDSSSRDVVEVVVSVEATGDYETLVLTETGPDTGRFFGPSSGLRLSKNRSVDPDDGELIVGVGDVMVARYEDSMDPSDDCEDTAEGGDPADSDSAVPTLGEWGLILLACGLGLAVVKRARRLAPAVR